MQFASIAEQFSSPRSSPAFIQMFQLPQILIWGGYLWIHEKKIMAG